MKWEKEKGGEMSLEKKDRIASRCVSKYTDLLLLINIFHNGLLVNLKNLIVAKLLKLFFRKISMSIFQVINWNLKKLFYLFYFDNI